MICAAYDIATWEVHHNQKADSPSGTALEIAKRVMEGYPEKTEMVLTHSTNALQKINFTFLQHAAETSQELTKFSSMALPTQSN